MSKMIDPQSVPQAIKDAFAAKFPSVETPSWEVEEYYEAEFTMENGREVEVNFAEDGELLQIEYEIDIEELPQRVLDTIKRRYPFCEIVEAERVELPDGRVFYEVDLAFEVHVSEEGILTNVGASL